MVMRCDERMEVGKRYVKTVSDVLDGITHNVPGLVLREATMEEWMRDARAMNPDLTDEYLRRFAARYPVPYYYDIAFD